MSREFEEILLLWLKKYRLHFIGRRENLPASFVVYLDREFPWFIACIDQNCGNKSKISRKDMDEVGQKEEWNEGKRFASMLANPSTDQFFLFIGHPPGDTGIIGAFFCAIGIQFGQMVH